MKSTRQQTILFISMFLMLSLTILAQFFLKRLQIPIVATAGGVSLLTNLKMTAPFVTIFAGLIIAFLSKDGSVKRTFSVFFPFVTIVLCIFSFLLYTNSDLLNNSTFATIFYYFTDIVTVISFVLILGFANQEYTFKLAAIQYPILFILMVIPLMLVFFLAVQMLPSPIDHASICLASIAGISLLIWIIYMVTNNYDLGVVEKGKTNAWEYLFALAAIIFTVNFAKSFPEMTFATAAKDLMPDIGSYAAFMGKFSIISSIFLGAAALIFGYIFYKKGAKILANVGYLFTAAMVVGGILTFYTLSAFPEVRLHSTTAGYTILLLATGVFMLVKELAFFGIKRKKRFTSKILIDVIVLTLAIAASRSISSTIIQNNAAAAITNMLVILFTVAMILCAFGFYRIHKDLKSGLPK